MTQMKVKLLKSCWCGRAGDVKEMHSTQAAQLIKDRFAVEDADHRKAVEKRAKESQDLQNKALGSKRSREKREADKKAKERAEAAAERQKAEDEKLGRVEKPVIENKAMSASK